MPEFYLQQMFVSIDSIRFPIPFKQITLGEQQLIERINSCRKSGRQLIGEAKLSDRQTTIILSYLITLLIDHNLEQSHQQETGKEDQQMKTVVYLCRGETRKNQLLDIAEKVYDFVLDALLKQQQKTFSLQKPQSLVCLKFYMGSADQDKLIEEAYQNCKAKGLIFRRISFMRTNQFLQLKLRRKQQSVWKKSFEFGCESDFDVLQLNYLNRKVDYLLIESNDLEGLMTQLLTVELRQIHLYRAFIQFRKLNKFYNFRIEEKKVKNPSRQGSKKDFDIKYPATKKQEPKNQEEDDGLQQASTVMKKLQQIQDEVQNKQVQASNQLQDQFFQIFRKKQEWSVSEYDKKFNQLYKQKKQLLMTAKVGYVPNTSVSPQYEECYYLMNLQIIGYILSFLIVEWKQNQFQQNHDNLNSYLNYIYSKTLIPTSYMRKLKRIFLSFVAKYPPSIKQQSLSFKYIKQILYFFEKAVIWNEVFCKPYLGSTQTSIDPNASQFNLGNRFVVLRQKTNKDSNLKILCFDQKILLDLLLQSSKGFSILQNLAISFEYYENIFRPQKFKDIQLEYRCPKLVGQFYKHTINGYIVSSTPNEQDLHLSNDRQELNTGDELLQDKKQDKDHYSQIIRSYGVLVHDICELIPDGVIVYFPTRALMKECRAEWESKENIYEKINQIKHIFQQEQWERDNLFNVYSYKKKCEVGRGAVYFLAADSQLAKYQNFYSYYSKCIIFLGVPYNPYPLETDQKLKFLKLKEHYHFQQALKNVCRCLSNCINSTSEIKTVVFADIAYNRTDLQKKWFPFIKEGNLNTLQVLDLILNVNKSSSVLIKKQKQQERKRRVQQMQRKREDNLDRIRRSHSQMVNDY